MGPWQQGEAGEHVDEGADPASVEPYEGLHVALADALAHPDAVVVVLLDADAAVAAVVRARAHPDVANVAVDIVRVNGLGVHGARAATHDDAWVAERREPEQHRAHRAEPVEDGAKDGVPPHGRAILREGVHHGQDHALRKNRACPVRTRREQRPLGRAHEHVVVPETLQAGAGKAAEAASGSFDLLCGRRWRRGTDDAVADATLTLQRRKRKYVVSCQGLGDGNTPSWPGARGTKASKHETQRSTRHEAQRSTTLTAGASQQRLALHALQAILRRPGSLGVTAPRSHLVAPEALRRRPPPVAHGWGGGGGGMQARTGQEMVFRIRMPPPQQL
eukprot:CAMPEP_0118888004 /NCGR_PEP_ID=MMETSP1163-20130328/25500_1 /TAXON_ID=124430 /ORGANISM="Phaeomonas parva, Strain CCMP2877" /LENGTH=332 /DNA_ID=CAMNT_0006826563 /DNA_START=477 /DNA_END=1476 /DNA_ORIENTATION=-